MKKKSEKLLDKAVLGAATPISAYEAYMDASRPMPTEMKNALLTNDKLGPEDLVKTQCYDAAKWADAFCEMYPQMEWDVMVGWFANAIMCCHDSLHNKKITPLQEEIKGLKSGKQIT
jgi:hypothetical protein